MNGMIETDFTASSITSTILEAIPEILRGRRMFATLTFFFRLVRGSEHGTTRLTLQAGLTMTCAICARSMPHWKVWASTTARKTHL